MAITLAYDNDKPNADNIAFSRQIKTEYIARVIRLQNEMYAGSGLSLSGLILPQTLTTTSTSFNNGTNHDLDLGTYSPSFVINKRNRTTDQVIFTLRAYTRNCSVRVRVYDMNDTLLHTNTAIAASNNFTWIGVQFAFTGLDTSQDRFIIVDMRRESYASSGELVQIAAVLRPTVASQLPI